MNLSSFAIALPGWVQRSNTAYVTQKCKHQSLGLPGDKEELLYYYWRRPAGIDTSGKEIFVVP